MTVTMRVRKRDSKTGVMREVEIDISPIAKILTSKEIFMMEYILNEKMATTRFHMDVVFPEGTSLDEVDKTLRGE